MMLRYCRSSVHRAVLLFLIIFMISGCADKAKELFETAQFEEKQYNRQHASELYRQIVEQYPKSEYAGKAKERLVELDRK